MCRYSTFREINYFLKTLFCFLQTNRSKSISVNWIWVYFSTWSRNFLDMSNIYVVLVVLISV